MNQTVDLSMTQAPTPVTFKISHNPSQSAIRQWSRIRDIKRLSSVLESVRAGNGIGHIFYNQTTA